MLDFEAKPGLLYVVATLLPLASFVVLLLTAMVRNALRSQREAGGLGQAIGMSGIKRRRLDELEVSCHPDTKVGDYVPFYFCPRSIMLYLIYMANHPELSYRGGQEPIVHLEADMIDAVAWADAPRPVRSASEAGCSAGRVGLAARR